jgi:hypothetical protein
VANDEHYSLADQFLGGDDRLLGVAEVIDRNESNVLTEYATRGIDVRHRHLRTTLALLSDPGQSPCHRTRDADQNLGMCPAGERNCNDKQCYGNQPIHGCAARTGL